MLQKLRDIFQVPELKRRILFTLALFVIYRLGEHMPTPGVNAKALAGAFASQAGTLFGLYDLFVGGAFSRATVFALGIMPYISSSIILQLLGAVIPYLEKLRKEGEEGQKKITQLTRYGTVIISIVQSYAYSVFLVNMGAARGLTVVQAAQRIARSQCSACAFAGAQARRSRAAKVADFGRAWRASCKTGAPVADSSEGYAVRQSSVRGLRTFCVAARCLSFKAAAEQLCVTPSAVSHQIKGLEQQLQTLLFERRTREIALTEHGAQLFAQVEPLLSELDGVTQRFMRHNGQRRTLRIALLPFFASEMFIPRLRAFSDKHRSIDIRVETTEAGCLHPSATDASSAARTASAAPLQSAAEDVPSGAATEPRSVTLTCGKRSAPPAAAARSPAAPAMPVLSNPAPPACASPANPGVERRASSVASSTVKARTSREGSAAAPAGDAAANIQPTSTAASTQARRENERLTGA